MTRVIDLAGAASPPGGIHKKEEWTMPNSVFTDKTDIKIFILTLLTDVTQPLDYGSIQEIICRSNLVNPYDFAQCFRELEDLGHIIHEEHDGEKYYTASPGGRSVAAELSDEIAESLREKSMMEAARHIALRCEGAKTACTVTEQGPRRYQVVCEATDRDGVALSVSIRIPDKVTAERIRRHYLEKPENCLRGILSVLTGEVDYLLGQYDPN